MKKRLLVLAGVLAVICGGVLFAVLPRHPISLHPSEVVYIELDTAEYFGVVSRKEQIEKVVSNLSKAKLGASSPCNREVFPEGVMRIVLTKKGGENYETLYLCRDGRLIYFDGKEPYSGTFYETYDPAIDVAYLESLFY